MSSKQSGKKNIWASRYKTQLCEKFGETGECRYNERCMFAHGSGELRTPEENLEAGLTTEGAIRKHQRKAYIQRREKSSSGSGSSKDGSPSSSTRAGCNPVLSSSPPPPSSNHDSGNPTPQSTSLASSHRPSANSGNESAQYRPTSATTSANEFVSSTGSNTHAPYQAYPVPASPTSMTPQYGQTSMIPFIPGATAGSQGWAPLSISTSSFDSATAASQEAQHQSSFQLGTPTSTSGPLSGTGGYGRLHSGLLQPGPLALPTSPNQAPPSTTFQPPVLVGSSPLPSPGPFPRQPNSTTPETRLPFDSNNGIVLRSKYVPCQRELAETNKLPLQEQPIVVHPSPLQGRSSGPSEDMSMSVSHNSSELAVEEQSAYENYPSTGNKRQQQQQQQPVMNHLSTAGVAAFAITSPHDQMPVPNMPLNQSVNSKMSASNRASDSYAPTSPGAAATTCTTSSHSSDYEYPADSV